MWSKLFLFIREDVPSVLNYFFHNLIVFSFTSARIFAIVGGLEPPTFTRHRIVSAC